MNAGTWVILLVLAVIVAVAVLSTVKHMRGEGGCCGGDSDRAKRKKLEGKLVAKKVIHINGMHCKNCKNRVEQQINQIDGAAAKVKLSKNLAIVSMTRLVSDAALKQAVERAGYEAKKIICEEL